MSRIGGIINENKRTFIEERVYNNRFIDLLNKQQIIVLLILDMSVKVEVFKGIGSIFFLPLK